MPPTATIQEVVNKILLLANPCPGIETHSKNDSIFDTFSDPPFIAPPHLDEDLGVEVNFKLDTYFGSHWGKKTSEE